MLGNKVGLALESGLGLNLEHFESEEAILQHL